MTHDVCVQSSVFCSEPPKGGGVRSARRGSSRCDSDNSLDDTLHSRSHSNPLRVSPTTIYDSLGADKVYKDIENAAPIVPPLKVS